MRRAWRVLLAAGVALPAAMVPTSATRAEPGSPVAVLSNGSKVFWPASDARRLPASDRCPAAECVGFALDVVAAAEQLRVASDGGFGSGSLRLYRPDGILGPSDANLFSAELFVVRPALGRWVVEWEPGSGGAAVGRLRARLGRVVPPKAGQLLPNLRLIPPHDVTFLPEAACLPDEVAEHGARRCLRFSAGPENVGAGPVDLRFEALTGLTSAGVVYQVVHHSDGRTEERKAGTFEYHKTHLHYHHSGFGSLELLKVTDPALGTMVPAGSGPKQGFCLAEYRMGDWSRFFHAPRGEQPNDCGNVDPILGARMGMGAGWGDIYTNIQSGNYVEFGDQGDGLYVIRSTSDALGQVLESNEKDNTGYAYVRVTGTDVEMLERGRGSGPWDPAKVVVNDPRLEADWG